MVNFMDIIHHPNFYLKRRFGGWILSPSLGKTLTLLCPVDRDNGPETGTSCIDWTHTAGLLSEYGDRVQFPKRRIKKIRTTDNIQKY
jgi:hypothetical protein